MDKGNLKQYLRYAMDLEKTIYIQDKVLYRLKNKIGELGHYGTISQPYLKQYESSESKFKTGVYSVIFFALWVVFSAIWAVIINADMNSNKGLLICLGLGVVSTIGVLFGIGYIYEYIRNIPYKEAYEYEMAEYNKTIEKDKQRVEKELRQKEILIQDYVALENQYKNTKKALLDFYSVGVIYPKYRNVAAICSFFEYIDSERCSQLEGHEGAYNKYDGELLLGRIIDKLDDIMYSLDEIKNSQNTLYSLIEESNDKIDSLTYETSKATKSASIAAYNAECANRELNTIKWLQIIDYHR